MQKKKMQHKTRTKNTVRVFFVEIELFMEKFRSGGKNA